MSRIAATKGKCYICKKELGKIAMKNHLLKCNNLGKAKTNYFMLKVEGFYNKNYWLYIQVKEDATLGDLDCFLRDIWLECCGHLSIFIIGETVYESNFDDDLFKRTVLDMNKTKLKDILKVGLIFKHEYDFASTTILKITVVEKYSGIAVKDKVTLLARNNIKEYICKKCGKKATYIVMGDDWYNYIPLCYECVKSCDEESFIMNITNSPRMGVCGYTGKNDIYQLD